MPEQVESTPVKCEPNYEDIVRLLKEFDVKYNGNLSPVGWVHNHPGYGLFMSPDDVEVHKFYPQKSVAMVIDTKLFSEHKYKFFTLEYGNIVEVPLEVDHSM